MTPVLLGLAAALAWSVHDLIARSLAARLGAFRMGLWIMVTGGLLLTGVVLWRGTLFAAEREGLLIALALGLAYACGAGGIYRAFSLGPVSVVGPLTALYPVLVVAWGVVNGLVPTNLQWLAVAAVLAGAVIVGRFGHADGGINAVDRGMLPQLLLACLVCSIGYAAAVVLGQAASVRIGAFEAAWISRATAILAFIPFALASPLRGPIPRLGWAGLAAMGALDVAGLVAVNASGHFPGKEFAAVGISTYAGISTLLAALLLRERVSALQWLGIGMIVAGVAAISFHSQ